MRLISKFLEILFLSKSLFNLFFNLYVYEMIEETHQETTSLSVGHNSTIKMRIFKSMNFYYQEKFNEVCVFI